MPASDRSLDAIAFVIEHFRDIVRRRISELVGLALITVALIGAIALATWSVQDPSLSHATQSPVRNLLGFPGAIFADLVMQLLGLAAVFLLAPEALIGWRLLSHRPVGEKWRGIAWVVAGFLGAAFASCLPRSAAWPLPTGLGGVVGDALLQVPIAVFHLHMSGMTALTTGLILGFALFVAIIMAARIPFPEKALERRKVRASEEEIEEDDEDEEEHGSVSLGMLVHALLSVKARIGRLFKGNPRPMQRIAMTAAPADARLEPRFGGASRTRPIVEPDFDDEEEGDDDDEAEITPRRRASRPAAVR
ncbi:MAG: DNA translocase FtsK 4TM domain-containing protein, partial [Pseudolabrys sp.]